VNPLSLIPIRFYVYGAIAAAFGFVLWREHHAAHRVRDLVAQVRTQDQQLKAARTEAREQKEASNAYHNLLDANRRGRGDTPARVVRVCPAGGVPAAAGRAPAPAAEGFPPAPGRDTQEGGSAAGVDVGPELYGLTDEADDAIAQCSTLIDWVTAHAPRE
jgi:hypothetical protein